METFCATRQVKALTGQGWPPVGEEVIESGDEDATVLGTAAVAGAAVGAVVGTVETVAESAEGEEPQTEELDVGGDDRG